MVPRVVDWPLPVSGPRNTPMTIPKSMTSRLGGCHVPVPALCSTSRCSSTIDTVTVDFDASWFGCPDKCLACFPKCSATVKPLTVPNS